VSTVITATTPHMDVTDVTQVLERVGIRPPLPVEGARVATLAEWLDRAAPKPPKAANPSVRQSAVPNKALQAALSELYLVNMEDADSLWGWADPRNTAFLEFFRDYDADARFVLIIDAPASALAAFEMREGNSGVAKTANVTRADVLAQWQAATETLLAFARAHPEQVYLSNGLAWRNDPRATGEALADWLGVTPASTLEIDPADPLADLVSQVVPLSDEESELVDDLWQEVLGLTPSPDAGELAAATRMRVDRLKADRLESAAQCAYLTTRCRM